MPRPGRKNKNRLYGGKVAMFCELARSNNHDGRRGYSISVELPALSFCVVGDGGGWSSPVAEGPFKREIRMCDGAGPDPAAWFTVCSEPAIGEAVSLISPLEPGRVFFIRVPECPLPGEFPVLDICAERAADFYWTVGGGVGIRMETVLRSPSVPAPRESRAGGPGTGRRICIQHQRFNL